MQEDFSSCVFSTLLLTVVLALFGSSQVGYADTETSSSPGLTSATAEYAAVEPATQQGPYPSSFDLRSVDTDGDGVGDRCYVTPVRCQYPFGTCWGFATTAAAETNILSTKLRDNPDAWKTLDFSEKQLAYFAHWHVTDPESTQYGEGIYSTKADPTFNDIYAGGAVFLGAHTYAAGTGPALESDDEALEYHGANVTVCKGATTTVSYELYGPEAEEAAAIDFTVTWGLADGGEEFVELVPNGDGTAQLVWKKPGKARLYVTVGSLGTAIADVTATETEHAWGKPTYTWTDDLSACTAERTCGACNETEAETVNSTSTITKEPTAASTGERTYTATFTNTAFERQTTTTEIPATFEDGAATAGFTVKAAEGSGSSDGSTPNTGDSLGNAAIVAAALAVASCVGLILARRRRRI